MKTCAALLYSFIFFICTSRPALIVPRALRTHTWNSKCATLLQAHMLEMSLRGWSTIDFTLNFVTMTTKRVASLRQRFAELEHIDVSKEIYIGAKINKL